MCDSLDFANDYAIILFVYKSEGRSERDCISDFERMITVKKKLKKVIQFITNPHLLICVFIAWMITNGWSYVFFGVGTYFGITWMIAVSSAYLAFLWLPVSPEKIVTFTIAIALLRLLFPNDTKTLAVLKNFYENTKIAFKKKIAEYKQKFSEWKNKRKK